MINWPTAFVIAAAMISGAFLYSNAITAHSRDDHSCAISGYGEIEVLRVGGDVYMGSVRVDCEHD